jgi:hypothetical protein
VLSDPISDFGHSGGEQLWTGPKKVGIWSFPAAGWRTLSQRRRAIRVIRITDLWDRFTHLRPEIGAISTSGSSIVVALNALAPRRLSLPQE